MKRDKMEKEKAIVDNLNNERVATLIEKQFKLDEKIELWKLKFGISVSQSLKFKELDNIIKEFIKRILDIWANVPDYKFPEELKKLSGEMHTGWTEDIEVIAVEYLKEKIQNAQKRLKEEIDKTKSSDKSGEWIISRKITLKKIIDKIFKEEFGDKLI